MDKKLSTISKINPQTDQNFKGEINMTRKIESLEDTKLRDLRRYLARAAAQLPSIEYTNYGIGCNFLTYQQNRDTSRRIRLDGSDWCLWLGKNAIIKNDEQLQAFFFENADENDGGDWSFLLKQFNRNRQKTMHLWQNQGREIISERARVKLEEASGAIASEPTIDSKYLNKGEDDNPLFHM